MDPSDLPSTGPREALQNLHAASFAEFPYLVEGVKSGRLEQNKHETKQIDPLAFAEQLVVSSGNVVQEPSA